MSCYAGLQIDSNSYYAFLKNGKATGWSSVLPEEYDILRNSYNIKKIVGSFNRFYLFKDKTLTGFQTPIHNEINNYIIPPVLQGKVVDIADGGFHILAILDNGSVTGWGSNNWHELDIPAGIGNNAVQIAAAPYRSLALLNNGVLTGWGNYYTHIQKDIPHNQNKIPANIQGNVTGIAAGQFHDLALLKDGSVVTLGNDNWYGQLNVPTSIQGNVTAIDAGVAHSLALLENGHVTGWGWNALGQINIPKEIQGNVIQIGCANQTSFALLNDGKITGWGNSFNNRIKIPVCEEFAQNLTKSFCLKNPISEERLCYNTTIYYNSANPRIYGSVNSLNGNASQLFLNGFETSSEVTGKIYVYNKVERGDASDYDLFQTINLPHKNEIKKLNNIKVSKNGKILVALSPYNTGSAPSDCSLMYIYKTGSDGTWQNSQTLSGFGANLNGFSNFGEKYFSLDLDYDGKTIVID